jgi:hypothetical protein
MVGWSSFAGSVPSSGTARERRFLELFDAGHVLHTWAVLTVQYDGQRLDLEVSEDALALGAPGDSVRINVTATTAQRLADRLGALLLTARLSDLIREHAAVVISPSNRTPTSAMGSTAWMVEHSREVDEKIAAALAQMGQRGLVCNAGKDWVITNRLAGSPRASTGLERAANYGWHVLPGPGGNAGYPAATPGLRVLQPVGLAHDRAHVDYSQTFRCVRNVCKVDGVTRALAEVLADPALAPALSHEGVLRVFRQPGVPAPAVVAPGGSPSPDTATDPPSDPPAPVRDPVATVPRVLRRGMRGPDVAAWQRVLGLTDDGVFGPLTEAATKRFQESNGLAPDGVVGPLTRAAASKALYPVAGVTAPWKTPERVFLSAHGADRALVTRFVEAKNKRIGRREPIELVVLHTMEAGEKPDTAERVAAWFAGPHAPMASAHYCVDSDSIVQCVKESDTAFHAPGANANGIGIEHAGYARQTPEDWADPYSQTMLRRSAELTASLCKRHGLPVTYVDKAGLLAKQRGITTHHDVSLAFRRSTHTDPGKSFPMESYLEMVREYLV